MFTSLLLAVSICGADPGIVFAAGDSTWAGSEVGSHSLLTSGSIFELTGRRNSDERSPSIRGQSVTDYPPARYDGLSEYNPFEWNIWEDPFVREFFSAMNPFHQEEIHTLPNYYDPFSSQMGTGSAGPPGYRLGWVTYNDITVLPAAGTRGATGSMQILEWNSNAKYSHLVAPGVLFNVTGWFSARWWEGPTTPALPGQVDQISSDLELGFFNDGPWSAQIAFHPQIVDTYEARLDANAFNFDGRAIATYTASPEWRFVAGIAVWDRVDLLVVPHSGVVWTPNDRWEFRILYPRSRISYFLGNWQNADFWLYGVAEYTAEAFQSVDKDSPTIDRMQITDDRLSLGLRSDSGRYSFFVEGGYVFNRRVEFAGSNPGFDLDNVGMIRVGMRY